AGGGQRVLHHPQVGEQLLRVGVGQVGIPAAGGGDPLGDHQHHPPVRFVRRGDGHLGGQLGGELVLPVPEQLQLGRGRGGDRVQRERGADGVGSLEQRTEHVVGGG